MRRLAAAFVLAVAVAWGCSSFSSDAPSSPTDDGGATDAAATDAASTPDAPEPDADVDETTCPGATFVDGFDQAARTTVQGEWSATYGTDAGALTIDGGELHAALPAHDGGTPEKFELVFAASGGTVRRACATFRVRVVAPTDFSPYTGRTVLAYFTSTATKDTFQSFILGHAGAYFESYPTPLNQPVLLPSGGARISILVRYPEREVRYFVDGVQKAQVTELTFDAGATLGAAQFTLGIDQEGATPGAHVVYDDVRIRFDP